MALPTASDNAFPSVLITEGTEPSAPAAGKQRVYIDSTSHHLSRTDSSGTQVDLETNQAAGGIATDAIWDAAGDTVVGTGANTAVRRKNNDGASAAPAVTDDSGDGYGIGSRWIDTTNDKEYVATDVSVGAAVWKETTGGAGGLDVYRRQGSSSTDWSAGGTTGYTPASNATVQMGVTAAMTAGSGPITVTFPVAFTNPPIVIGQPGEATVNGNGFTVMITNVTATSFDCYPSSVPAPSTATAKIHWIAIGI